MRMVLVVLLLLPACQSSGTGGDTTRTGGTSGISAGGNSGLATGGGGGRDIPSSGGVAGSATRTGGSTGGLISGGQSGSAGSAGHSVDGGVSPIDGGMDGAGGAAKGGLTIYYMRHAEVLANVDPQATDGIDTFTDLGQRQITALTTYLQGLSVTPDAILVSPAPRAQSTIQPYLAAKGITGEIWMNLHESSDKAATGAPLPTAPTYYSYWKATAVADNLVFRDPKENKFWQTDTYEAGLFMVTTAKDEILDRFGKSGKTIFVVGHAIAGQLMIGLLLGQDLSNGPPTTGSSAIFILNTGVMKLTQDPTSGAFKLDGRNVNNPPR